MSNKHLNLGESKPAIIIPKPAGVIPKQVKTIPKLSTVIAAVMFIVAVFWTSLPAFATPGQTNSESIGTSIGTLNCSGLTLQCELDAGIAFTNLIPGPRANWHLNLTGDCVWQVNPAVTIVGRGHALASIPCLSTDPGSALNVCLSLDRLFLQYEAGRARATIGKQAVNWGLATIFRPTDLITPRAPGGFGEGRPGKTLVTLFWRTSPLTGVELILGENLYAGRGEFRIGQTNFGILGLTNHVNPAGSKNPATIGNEPNIMTPTNAGVVNAVGLDFQGGLRGFYGEVCHNWTDTGQHSSDTAYSGAPAAPAITSATIGWKTMLRGGNLIFAEYYRNHVRLDNINAVTRLAALGLTYQYDEFTTFGLVGIADLTDSSWTATGTLTSLLTENLDLNCSLSITNESHAQAQVMVKWYL